MGPVVISEVHYQPGPPTAAALLLDPKITANDLEYVEIHNPAVQAVELTEWRIRGGVDYDFVPGTLLPGGGTLLVMPFNPSKPENANRLAAFRAQYQISAAVPLVGGYSGQLLDEGEAVRLQRPDAPPLDEPTWIPRLLEDEVSLRSARAVAGSQRHRAVAHAPLNIRVWQ